MIFCPDSHRTVSKEEESTSKSNTKYAIDRINRVLEGSSNREVLNSQYIVEEECVLRIEQYESTQHDIKCRDDDEC